MSGMSQDPREAIYRDLLGGQLAEGAAKNRASARRIFALLAEFDVRPASLVDVGCGTGEWLAAARDIGITDVRGIEGNWLDKSNLPIEASLVETHDLETGFDLGRRFDLVLCIEVAEHVTPASAERLVASLTRHSDLVLFSAAIPFQRGHHHVNEQFPDYWAERFAPHQFHPLDFLRPRIWKDASIIWWLRQNLLLFAHDRALQVNPKLATERDVQRVLSVVHPSVYLGLLNEAYAKLQEQSKLMQFIAEGGAFRATRHPDGKIDVTRLPAPPT